jgi:septal ring factor EnvC (AmiA/AmiB activator)
MLIASVEIVTSSLPLFIAEVIGAGLGLFGLASYLRHSNVKAQLSAKDAIIATNQQTIEAFEERLNALDAKVEALETELSSATIKNASLTDELRDWENKYRHLENFAAPALGERLIKMFERQEEVLDKIVNALEGIQSRIDALEGKSE